jgi:hypothetical protein
VLPGSHEIEARVGRGFKTKRRVTIQVAVGDTATVEVFVKRGLQIELAQIRNAAGLVVAGRHDA